MTAQSFVTEDGVTVPAISAKTMREMDRIAIGEVGPNLFQMMENAGRALAATALRRMTRVKCVGLSLQRQLERNGRRRPRL